MAYSEGQYYHDGVTSVPSWKQWRPTLPPMLYPTHATAFYVGITGGRLVKVTCLGSRGEGEEWRQNRYQNPFVNESAAFHTSEGTMFRCNVLWQCDLDGEYGMRVWDRPPKVKVPDRVMLPSGMEYGGHGGSHGPPANEFLTAILENREPTTNIYECRAGPRRYRGAPVGTERRRGLEGAVVRQGVGLNRQLGSSGGDGGLFHELRESPPL